MSVRSIFPALVASAVAMVGCGYDVEDYCQDMCDCEGCSDKKLEECIDDGEDAYDEYVDEGCEDQADDYLSCLGDEGECEDGDDWDADGCKSEIEDLNECMSDADPQPGGPGSGSSGPGGGGSVCDQAAALCGSTFPDCSGTTECLASCVVSVGNCTDANSISACQSANCN